MAQQQEDGWPLGLWPLNAKVGLVRNGNLSGSVSFNTVLDGFPSSSIVSSPDLDTESTGSFLHDKSITFGKLIGVSNILKLSRRSTRTRTTDALRDQKNYKTKPWLFSLCSKLTTDTVNTNNTQSLGHFLEAERRAASIYTRNQNPAIYGHNDFSYVSMTRTNDSQILREDLTENYMNMAMNMELHYCYHVCGQLIT